MTEHLDYQKRLGLYESEANYNIEANFCVSYDMIHIFICLGLIFMSSNICICIATLTERMNISSAYVQFIGSYVAMK